MHPTDAIHPSVRPWLTFLSSCLALGLAVGPAQAQGSGQAKDIPGGPIPIQFAPAGAQPDLPFPPRGILANLSPHRDAPIPIGTGTLPMPASPPSQVSQTGPLAFAYFVNQVCKPAGAGTLSIGEPSCALNRDIAFQTGNLYAALSIDSGMTWTYVSPYTMFPASDAGFCCDQRTVYIPSRDITVWLLQYNYSAATQHGRYRIAVSRGRDNLKNRVWYYYDWTPENFGYPVRRWLDFPDLAYAQDQLHVSANVYDDANPVNFIGSVRWRISLTDLRNQVAAPDWSYGTSATFGGFAYRFSAGVTGPKIWYGANIDTTTIRVFEYDEATQVNTWNDRTVPVWSTNAAAAPGPDGRDWAGRCVGRIRGAYGNANEVGFMWGSGAQGAARPQGYTRVSRFKTSDRTKIADDDIWNPTSAFLYATGCSNDAGATGGVLAIGGGTVYPESGAFIVPPGGAFAPINATIMATGTHGPSANGWGDYFTVMRHPIQTCSWIATGMGQNGGPADGQNDPRYVWFGDNASCNPSSVRLSLTSTPFNNVTIIPAQTDLDGSRLGNTPFVRRFAQRQGYTLLAPVVQASGGTYYTFQRWVVNGVPGVIGEPLVDVPDAGVVDNTAVAQYIAIRTINVFSTNPSAGTQITMSLADLAGNKDGMTPFTRNYKDSTAISLTAPPAAGANPFKRWRINGVNQALGVVTANLTPTADVNAIADYFNHVSGSFRSFGTGCAGSNGVNVQSAGGTPETTKTANYSLFGGRRNGTAFFMIGFSDTQWAGLPLPLSLSPIAPGCSIYCEVDATIVAATNAAGSATVNLPIPDDVNLINGHFWTQFWCVDPGVNALNVTFSNGVDTTVGGNQ